ncbi:MAG: hypothetical protein EB117_16425 [Betaproteobacteria bacterium]|nr:hypothetical protein [Betaproteobacteria bacterium]
MQRVAHIVDGEIRNVFIVDDDWRAPVDGSRMLESEAIAAGFVRVTPPAPLSAAPSWKVKVWLVRQGLSSADIEATIRQAIEAGPEQDEAILRWQHAPEFPFEHPLVGLVAEALDLDVTAAWPEILAI